MGIRMRRNRMITHTETISVTHDDEFAKEIKETLSKDKDWYLVDEDTGMFTYRKIEWFRLERETE